MKFHQATVLLLASISGSSNAFGVVNSRALQHGNSVETRSNSKLFGILDDVRGDNFVLGQTDDAAENAGISKQMEIAYESFLAELVFSPNDPRLDIIDNFERTSDPEWLEWLDDKIAYSSDPEERMALKDLRAMIDDVVQKMELSRLAEERMQKEEEEKEAARLANLEAEATEGRSLSGSDLLKRANKVNTAGVDQELEKQEQSTEKVSFINSELTPEIRMSYESLVKQLLPPYQPGESVNSVVYVNYDKIDAQLVKVLTELAENGDADAKSVLSALGEEQQKRLAAATELLKEVLSAGDPPRMEGKIVKFARDGRIDEPFLLLLEANANQAKTAGAAGPAQLMMRLKQKAVEEKDKKSSSKEITLLRKLLREESSTERQNMIEDAFTPRENILVRILSTFILLVYKQLIPLFNCSRLKALWKMLRRLRTERYQSKKNQFQIFLHQTLSIAAKQSC